MAKKRKNASIRKFKKSMKKTLPKRSHAAFATHIIAHKRKLSAAKRKTNPVFSPYTVYDDSGKAIVKTKSKKAATYIARAASGHVTKGTKVVYSATRKANPRKGRKNPAMLFPNRTAALTYAATHGLKNFSVSKVRKAR